LLSLVGQISSTFVDTGSLTKLSKARNPRARKIEIGEPVQHGLLVQSPREKYLVSVFQKHVILSPASRLARGALRESSRTLGWDAADAAASGAIVAAGRGNS
jgi:hypothetical protein